MSIINQNLLAYWPLNDDSTTAVTNYTSGSSLAGTLTGSPTIVTDTRFGRVLQLDGTNDYVSIASTTLDLSSDNLTISFWAQGDSSLTTMSNLTVLHAQNTAGTKTIEVKYPSTGMVSFEAGDASSTDSASSTVNLADYNTTIWVHWAFTKDSTSDEMKIYRNGVLVATTTSKSQTLGTFNEIYLGASKT
ncbi:MAG TPA: hypothetical protein DCS93_19455, partial [Microscillaceae bacterium]|nr:hypothetical protein [Microscillaceae bacterium]